MNNRITFAITTYINNSERKKYLYECINSIINQTNPNWEILISDDNSPINLDFSKYKKERKIKIFKQDKNIGMFNGWNFLLKKCNTDWFIPMGDDDIVENNMVEKIMSIVNKNKNADVIFTKVNYINSYGRKINGETIEEKYLNNGINKGGIDFLNKVVINSFKNGNTFLCSPIKTLKLKKLGGYKDYGNISDVYMLYLVSLKLNIYYCNDALIKIRKHNKNASNNILNSLIEQKKMLPIFINNKNYLSYEGLKYLKNQLRKTYVYIIIYNIINMLKLLGIYKYLSPLWRKFILKNINK